MNSQISSKSKSSMAKIDDCPICLDKKVDMLTICSHRFCHTCIEAALKKHNFCPLCRKFDPFKRKPPGEDEPEKVPSQEEWNVEVARRATFKKIEKGLEKVVLIDENGKEEDTNVFVSKGTNISVSPNTNIMINGKRVNPNDCNHQ